jgi:hypothetical protein
LAARANGKTGGEKSWFSDFSVADGLVTIRAVVTLKNAADADAAVSLTAEFTRDVQGVLLAEARLQGKNADGGTMFQVPAKSAASFAVTFEGASGGAARKHNRLLPEIEVTVIE